VDATKVHKAIMEKAEQHQTCMAGYRAMESLSCETGTEQTCINLKRILTDLFVWNCHKAFEALKSQVIV